MYLTCLPAKVHALQMMYLDIFCEKYFPTLSCVFYPHTCLLFLISQIPIPDPFFFYPVYLLWMHLFSSAAVNP